jgi:hypothetical protein
MQEINEFPYEIPALRLKRKLFNTDECCWCGGKPRHSQGENPCMIAGRRGFF